MKEAADKWDALQAQAQAEYERADSFEVKVKELNQTKMIRNWN